MALLANRAHETPCQLAQTAAEMIGCLDRVRVVPFGSSWGSFEISALVRVGATQFNSYTQEELEINTYVEGEHIFRPTASMVHGLDYMYEPVFGGAPGINNTDPEDRLIPADQKTDRFIYETVENEGIYSDSYTANEHYAIGMGVTPLYATGGFYSRDATVFLRGGFFKILWKSGYNWSPLAKFPAGTLIDDAQVEITVPDDPTYPPRLVKTVERLFYQPDYHPSAPGGTDWWNSWTLMNDWDDEENEILPVTTDESEVNIAIGFLGETPSGEYRFLGSFADDSRAVLKPGLKTTVSFKQAAQFLVDSCRGGCAYKDIYFYVCPIPKGTPAATPMEPSADNNRQLLLPILETCAAIDSVSATKTITDVTYHHYVDHWPSVADRLDMYGLHLTRTSWQFLMQSLVVGTPVVRFTLPDSALTKPADYGTVPDLRP